MNNTNSQKAFVQKSGSGFTLVELLVVIAIIGVLTAVIIAGTNILRARGRDTQRQAALLEIQQGLSLYASDHGGMYPPGGNGSGSGGPYYASQCQTGGSLSANNVITGLVAGGYIPSMPADSSMVAASNQDCIIYVSNSGTDYKVIDYNMVDSPNPGAQPALVDQARNHGQSYANETCGNPFNDSSKSWAIWSSTNSKCW